VTGAVVVVVGFAVVVVGSGLVVVDFGVVVVGSGVVVAGSGVVVVGSGVVVVGSGVVVVSSGVVVVENCVGSCVGLPAGDCVAHAGRWFASETCEHIVLAGIICDAPPRKKFLPATVPPLIAKSTFHEDTFLYLKDTTLSAAAALKGPAAFGLSEASPSLEDSKTVGSLWHTPSPPLTAEKPGVAIF